MEVRYYQVLFFKPNLLTLPNCIYPVVEKARAFLALTGMWLSKEHVHFQYCS